MKSTAMLMAVALFVAMSAPARGQELIWRWAGPGDLDLFGNYLDHVDDLDGDGCDEILIGEPGGSSDAGSVHVMSGRTGHTIVILSGENVNDGFAIVSGAGDFDGDGVSEFLVGAPGVDTGKGIGAGRVYVYSGVTRSLIQKIDGSTAGNHFCVCRGIGDLTGDGVSDYLIGEPSYSSSGPFEIGRLWVYSGSTHQPLRYINGEAPWNYFSSPSASVGDVDQDGFDDFAVSASSYDGAVRDIGRVYLFSGHNYHLLWSVDGEQKWARLGVGLAGAGDVDGDGVPDVIAGTLTHLEQGLNVGKAYVFSGRDGSTIHSWTGTTDGELFGTSVAGLGDLNGDGYTDVAVGAPGALNSTGQVHLYSGRTGRLLYTITGPDTSYFGPTMASAGDVNADGITDLMVWAAWEMEGTRSPGVVRVYAGNDLYLQAVPRQGTPAFSLETRGGPPGAEVVLYLLKGPTGGILHKVANGRLDQNGEWSVRLPASHLKGKKLTFQAFAQVPSHTSRHPGGRWIDSGRETVVLK